MIHEDYTTTRNDTQEKKEKFDKKIKHFKCLYQFRCYATVKFPPIGGGTISETMIITMMGYPIEALPILTIIAAIIDPPATMLNVVGDTSSSMLCARVVDGKDWMDKKKEESVI